MQRCYIPGYPLLRVALQSAVYTLTQRCKQKGRMDAAVDTLLASSACRSAARLLSTAWGSHCYASQHTNYTETPNGKTTGEMVALQYCAPLVTLCAYLSGNAPSFLCRRDIVDMLTTARAYDIPARLPETVRVRRAQLRFLAVEFALEIVNALEADVAQAFVGVTSLFLGLLQEDNKVTALLRDEAIVQCNGAL